ncbi:hypothetical protein D3C85_1705230 [compost metagenome]
MQVSGLLGLSNHFDQLRRPGDPAGAQGRGNDFGEGTGVHDTAILAGASVNGCHGWRISSRGFFERYFPIGVVFQNQDVVAPA